MRSGIFLLYRIPHLHLLAAALFWYLFCYRSHRGCSPRGGEILTPEMV